MKPSNPKLLIVCKNFFIDAKRLVSVGDDLSMMKAVMFLDFAIETLLNVLINDFDSVAESTRDDIKWTTLWQNASNSVKKQKLMAAIPNYKELKTLHEIRNFLQHKGICPKSSDVFRFIEPTQETLSECIKNCYDLNFPELKLWDLISNASLRLLLVESAQAFEMGKNVICLAGCQIAFKKINSAIQAEKPSSRAIDQIIQSSYTKSRPPGYSYDRNLSRHIDALSEKISTAFRELHEDTEIANLGLSLATTSEFRKFTNSIHVNCSVNGIIELIKKGGISDETYKEFAKSALDYISDLALLAQEVYPNIIAKIEVPIPLSKQRVWN